MSKDVVNGHRVLVGAEKALGTLEAGIANLAVSDAERAYLKYPVTTYSAKLQAAEQSLGQMYFLPPAPPIYLAKS
jgi:hypothetical protein